MAFQFFVFDFLVKLNTISCNFKKDTMNTTHSLSDSTFKKIKAALFVHSPLISALHSFLTLSFLIMYFNMIYVIPSLLALCFMDEKTFFPFLGSALIFELMLMLLLLVVIVIHDQKWFEFVQVSTFEQILFKNPETAEELKNFVIEKKDFRFEYFFEKHYEQIYDHYFSLRKNLKRIGALIKKIPFYKAFRKNEIVIQSRTLHYENKYCGMDVPLERIAAEAEKKAMKTALLTRKLLPKFCNFYLNPTLSV